jgi:hypothetical protein
MEEMAVLRVLMAKRVEVEVEVVAVGMFISCTEP